MPQIICPECGAGMQPGDGSAGGRCSSCGADLKVSDLGNSPDQRDAGFDTTTGPAITRALPALPDASKLRVIESSDDRLILFIPGGGKQATGLGCFSLFWNAFMVLFTSLWIGAALNNGGNGQPDAPWFAYPFIGVFWLIGLGMGWIWLRMKFQRTILLLERERVVLQHILFGRRRLIETTIGPGSQAELVESYKQNDKPVYRIEITGPESPARFGTALSDPEKDWIVDRVNEFLGVPTFDNQAPGTSAGPLVFPEECDECDAPLSGHAINGVLTCEKCGAKHEGWPDPTDQVAVLDATSPDDELAHQTLRVVESTDERLMIELRRQPNSPQGFVASLVGIPMAFVAVCGAAYGIIGNRVAQGGAGPFGLAALIPVLAFGTLILVLILYAFYGRTEIDLTRERLICRWRAGIFRYSRTFPTQEITSVRVEDLSQSRQPRRRRIRGGPTPSGVCTCVVRASGGKMIPLTILQTNACSREVERLIRGKLTEWDLLPKS